MSKYTAGEKIKAAGLLPILKYMESDPDKNAPKVLEFIAKFDKKGTVAPQVNQFREVMSDPTNNWCQLIRRVWNDYDEGVRKKFLENFIIYSTVIGYDRRKALVEKYDCNVPWAILMDPTSACNLKCTGCWAAEYGHKLNLSYEELDNIIEQGKEMGTYMYIYTGGEPLVRKNDIIKLCEKHSDCYFLSFTNSTLIDQAFCDEMLRVQNFIPAISVEGFEEATDSRRGEGTYKKIMDAMDLLTKNRLPFGVSICYTNQNVDSVSSDEFMDHLVKKGALFAWYFAYMPVGKGSVKELMVNKDQRTLLYRQIRKWRGEKPIFTLDFMNDAEYVGGCIAGGKKYLHINANGDIEPCVFAHYSDSNIREKTLLEAYMSPMFMQYRKNMPFNDNMLRPCPILDNKDVLANMVAAAKAKSTDLEAPEEASDYCAKTHDTIDQWAPWSEKLWEENRKEAAERKAKLAAFAKK